MYILNRTQECVYLISFGRYDHHQASKVKANQSRYRPGGAQSVVGS